MIIYLVQIAANNGEKYIRESLDSSYQGVKRLFVFAYNNTEGNNHVSIDSFRKYFLPTVKIENYNIEIDGGNLDQPINDSIKHMTKYDWSNKSRRRQCKSNNLLYSWTIKRNNIRIF